MTNLVLIDESYKNIDLIISRYVFGHVIIPEKNIKEFEIWIKNNIENDKLRFSNKEKMHFSELTTTQQDVLVEKISKMPITCKLYITYINNYSSIKQKLLQLDLLINSIRHHQNNKPNSKYLIEESSEQYTNIKKYLPRFDISIKPFSNYKSLLIPDVMLGVFCSYLDKNQDKRQNDINKWHTLIYNQIRLEVIDFQPKIKLFLSRDKKII